MIEVGGFQVELVFKVIGVVGVIVALLALKVLLEVVFPLAFWLVIVRQVDQVLGCTVTTGGLGSSGDLDSGKVFHSEATAGVLVFDIFLQSLKVLTTGLLTVFSGSGLPYTLVETGVVFIGGFSSGISGSTFCDKSCHWLTLAMMAGSVGGVAGLSGISSSTAEGGVVMVFSAGTGEMTAVGERIFHQRKCKS